GGAALSGAYLGHRLSADLDLFAHDPDAVRQLVRDRASVAEEASVDLRIVRDAGSHVRFRVSGPSGAPDLELDIVHEPAPDLEPPPPPIEGVVIESLTDLRASKVACLLERTEPRDLVDLLFLERAGFRPEADLALAMRKDAGVDPGVLA